MLYVSLSGLDTDRDAALNERVGSVSGAIDEAQQQLTAQADSVAHDQSVLSVLYPSTTVSPLLGSAKDLLLSERIADLILVLDANRKPVIRAPSRLAFSDLRLPPSLRRGAVVAMMDGHMYVLGVAPVLPPEPDRVPAGPVPMALVGRRLEQIIAPLVSGSPRVDIAVIEGDDLVWSTLAGLPAGGWKERTDTPPGQARRFQRRDQQYGLYAVTRVDNRGIWAIVPRGRAAASSRPPHPWRFSTALGVLGLLGGLSAWFGRRHGDPAESAGEGPPGNPAASLEPHGRNRELEVLNAIAVTIGRSTDLGAIAAETLDMLRSLTRVDVGAFYRRGRDPDRLILLAQRGLGPEMEEDIRVRPVAGTGIGETVRTGRPTVTRLDHGDIRDPAVRAIAGERGHRTQVALPIMVEGEPWGVMALVSRERRDFGRDELRLLETVAHQVGVAVERMAHHETATARLQRLEALREIETHISAQLELERVLDLVVRSALRLIGGAGASVFLREGDVLRARAWQGMGAWVRETVIPLGSGVAGRAVEERRGVLVNDCGASGMALPAFAERYARVLAQPLMAGDQVLGVLGVNRDADAPAFTPDDLAVLADFATPAAIAIGNARLFEEARGYALRLRALQEVNLAVSASLDLDAILDTLTRTAADFFRAELATVWVADDAGRWLERRSVSGDPALVSDLVGRLDWGRGVIGWIAARQMPVMAADLSADESAEYRAWALRHGLSAFTGMPLAVGGRLLGVLTLNRRGSSPLSSEEVAMLHAMAAQAAIALDNARLYGAATARGQRLTAVSRLTESLTATLGLDEVLSRVTASALELFGSGVARLWLVDEGGHQLTQSATAGSRTGIPGVHRLRLGEGLIGDIAATGRSLVIDDLVSDPRLQNRDWAIAEGTRSFAGVPLVVGDRLLGVLSVAVREARGFDAEDVSVLQSLANHAAIAIADARLYSTEQSRRRQIEALAEIARELASELDPDRLLPLVVERAGDFFRADGTIFLLGPEGGLTPAARRGVEVVAVGQGITGRCAALREGLLVNDYPTTADALPEAIERGVHRVMAQPLVAGDRLLGVISMYRFGAAAAPFGADDLEALERFATQAAVALQNARLYREAREYAERLLALEEVNRLVSSSLQVTEVLRNLAAAAARFFEAPYVSVWVMEPSGDRLRRVVDQGDAGIARALASEVLLGEGDVGWAARHRESIPGRTRAGPARSPARGLPRSGAALCPVLPDRARRSRAGGVHRAPGRGRDRDAGHHVPARLAGRPGRRGPRSRPPVRGGAGAARRQPAPGGGAVGPARAVARGDGSARRGRRPRGGGPADRARARRPPPRHPPRRGGRGRGRGGGADRERGAPRGERRGNPATGGGAWAGWCSRNSGPCAPMTTSERVPAAA